MIGNEGQLLSTLLSDAPYLSTLDAILVLGGGRPNSLFDPPDYVKNRCDAAAEIYFAAADAAAAALSGDNSRHPSPAILLLSAGTAHLPNLPNPQGSPGSAGGPAVYEATASAAYLLSRHPRGSEIAEGDVLVETTSYDTISNAYYSRSSFGDVLGWRNVLVITSSFHMKRSRIIFDWVFGASANGCVGRNAYKLRYLPTPDVGLKVEEINARKERENKSATNIQTNLVPKYTTMGEILKFLTSDHDLYSAKGLIARSTANENGVNAGAVDASIVKSYGGSGIGSGDKWVEQKSIISVGLVAVMVVTAFLAGKRNGATKAHRN